MEGKLRLRYSKTGKAKYISHLDLMATMSRALIRLGVSLSYSQGYNPHPFMSVALPLSIGCGSICELMDFGIADETSLPTSFTESLTLVLPDGITILESYKPLSKFSKIAWIDIEGEMLYDNGISPSLVERLLERFNEKSIVVEKKTKRGFSDFDIAPFIKDVNIYKNENDNVLFKAKVSAQNPTINTENIIKAINGEYDDIAPDYSSFTRMDVYDSEMIVFR
ncbi:MAG: TIGR03936 family radical SAM-associated protein [Oscillospiraceae bacterium]|nr:TIGR03936 family radical SAM-associated protein [Oscillospiraceae bacterium]